MSTSVRRVTKVPQSGFVSERRKATPAHARAEMLWKVASACTLRMAVLSKTGFFGNCDVVGDGVCERVSVELDVDDGE